MEPLRTVPEAAGLISAAAAAAGRLDAELRYGMEVRGQHQPGVQVVCGKPAAEILLVGQPGQLDAVGFGQRGGKGDPVRRRRPGGRGNARLASGQPLPPWGGRSASGRATAPGGGARADAGAGAGGRDAGGGERGASAGASDFRERPCAFAPIAVWNIATTACL